MNLEWTAGRGAGRPTLPPEAQDEHYYRLGGLVIAIGFQGDGCQAAVERLLAAFPVTTIDGPTSPELRLEVKLTEAPLQPPASAVEIAYGLPRLEQGEQCTVWNEAAIFATTPALGKGVLTLQRRFLEQPLAEQHNLFLLGLSPLLLARGLYDLHAAGLVHNETGYVILGASGSGKSTTTLSLVRAGWHWLSDDALLLRDGPDGIAALGFRPTLSLDPRLSTYWPELSPWLEPPVSTAGEDKRFLDPEMVYPGQRQEVAFPSVLLFNTISATPRSTLTPVDKTAALLELIRQSPSLGINRRSAAAHLALLRRLLAQTRCYRLHAGRDVYEASAQFADFLTEATR